MEYQPDLIECLMCNLRFNGVIPCATHLLTKAHQRKKLESISLAESSLEVGIINLIFQKLVPQAVEDPTQLLYCELCDVKTTDVEPMLAHYKSRKHAKNLNFHAETKKHVDFQTYHNRLLKLAEEVNQRNKGIFQCRICSVVMSTKPKYNIHLKSKKHYKSLNAIRSAKIIAKFHRDLRWKLDGTFVESSELVQCC
ncbi:zinc finger protein 346-like [Argiope bruennichi]|uniref:zinc finger protein 346-like n=1 Tax=Argiope bruennichi TaxID=94029 RepID=UPI0024945EE3|nr:zinc finger protein 346-like [Argiope bruennichi]